MAELGVLSYFITDMNSSDGRVWVAYGSSKPTVYNVNDTSNM